LKTPTKYATFLKATGSVELIPIGLKKFKAAGAVTKEFPKAASTRIELFPKAIGVDKFSLISSLIP
jgi:hypothetical protein